MALVCDTSGIFALYDADDANHLAVKAIVEKETGPLLLTVVLLAEIDYLLVARLGMAAALDFLTSVNMGAFQLVPLEPEDLSRCRELVEQYQDLSLGIADASVVATAERLGVPRLLTLDERHFRVIAPRGFSHFVLMPADGAN